MDTLLVILGVAAAVAVLVIIMHNGIIQAFNMVKRAWADVHTYERQKINILEALEPVVRQHADHESQTLKEIAALRSSIMSMGGEPDAGALARVQGQTDQLLKGLSVVVENYPELKASSLFQDLMENIRRQNENVGAAIAIFNRNVEIFNSKIETIPTNLVNQYVSHKPRIDEFRDSRAGDNIEYRPNF